VSGQLEDALELLGDPLPDGTWDNASTYSDCLRVDVLAAAGPSTALNQAYARIKLGPRVRVLEGLGQSPVCVARHARLADRRARLTALRRGLNL
jgi:hypothetical protein